MDFEPWGWFQSSFATGGDNDQQMLDNNQKQNEFPPKPVKDEPSPVEEETNEETNEDEGDEAYITAETSMNFPNTTTIDNLDDDALFDFSETPTKPSDADQSQEALVDYEPSVVYICPACGAEFDQQDVWKRHLNKQHDYNTRTGLNFVQVDRLYHECLECHKQIAMHAMENLLKHKFTHLPFRCVKCRICLRQYKYRQDLMVHLKTVHGAELQAHAANEQSDKQKEEPQSAEATPPPPALAIADVQANAVEIFENSNDGVTVRNEFIDDYDVSDDDATAGQQFSFGEAGCRDESRSSSHESGENISQERCEQELLELYVHYSCPECGTEFGSRSEWLQHIDHEHGYTTREGLNFKLSQKQVQCLECKKVLFDTTIANMQQHKFSHMNCSSWLRCKLCFRPFVGQKPIIKHLVSQHRLGNGPVQDVPVTHPRPKYRLVPKARDNYEPHIEHLCPQCGKSFADKKLWRKHIIVAHRLTDLQVLRFQVIDDSHVRCLECDKIITNAYGVQNAQQHAITHMPYKAFVRCRLCAKTYTDRKGLVKHLNSKHRSIIMGVTNHHEWQRKMDMRKLRREQQRQQAILNAATAKLKAKQEPLTETVHSNGETFIIKFLDDDEEPAEPAACQIDQDDDELLVEMTPKRETPKSERPSVATKLERDDDEKSNASGENLLVPSTRQRDDDAEEEDEMKPPERTNELRQTGIEKNFCFLCPACGVVFACQYDWRRHINSVHFDKRQYLNFRPLDKYRYQCGTCGDVVNNPKLKGLQDHKFRHLPYRLYIKCMICSTCYNHKPNMMSHLRIRHGIEESPFASADKSHIFNRSSGGLKASSSTSASPMPVALTAAGKLAGLSTVEDCISYHNAVDHESITYHCPQCDMLFDTHVFWRKHIVEEHNLNNREGLNFRQIDAHHFLCLQCYKRVTVTHTKGAIGQLQSHKFRHLPYRSFHCKACSCEFVRKQMFFKHLNRKTNKCGGNQTRGGRPEFEVTDHDDTETPPAVGAPTEGDDPAETVTPTVPTVKSYRNQEILGILCPQCGLELASVEKWHQHLSAVHQLDQKDHLGFEQLDEMGSLFACHECGTHLRGWHLSHLQQHKFKHLPHHSYIQCKLCVLSFPHLRDMYVHLRQVHPYVEHSQEEQAKLVPLLDYVETPPTAIEEIAPESLEHTQPVPYMDDLGDDQYVLG